MSVIIQYNHTKTYNMEDKIKIIRFLEYVTLGATPSKGLEYMSEPQLDDLIRLCKVNPTDEASMQNVRDSMARHEAFRTERTRKIKQIQAEELNLKYDKLSLEMKRRFIEFVLENLNKFTDMDMDWVIDPIRYPSVEFWTGVHGMVMNEIVCRLVFGLQEKENRDPIDTALSAQFTYGETIQGPICNDVLIDALDSEMKHTLFWKYAKAILYENTE